MNVGNQKKKKKKGEYVPTIPNTVVKIVSSRIFEKEEMDVAQPLSSAAAAGLGHVESVMKAGEELLK